VAKEAALKPACSLPADCGRNPFIGVVGDPLMLWLLIALWFLPPLMFLAVFLVVPLTSIGGRRSKVVRTNPVAAGSCVPNVTDTSAAAHGPARRGTPDQT
jgi:hypothetical protein